MTPIQKLSTEIIAVRRQLSEHNDFDIGRLLAFPRFFDWVQCHVDHSMQFHMYLADGDDGVALRFFWNGSFEPTSMALWSNAAREARAIIDIGAHTGCYSLAAAAAGRRAEVWSFEPHFMNFARLTMNLRANAMSTNRAYPIACGERNATVPFSVAPGADFLTSGGRVGRNPGLFVRDVQMVTLDQFFSDRRGQFPIDLVKIDTEGYESQCIEGMLGILKRDKPVVFFESIDVEGSKRCQQLLQGSGYHFFLVNDESGDVSKVDVVAPVLGSSGKVPRKWHNRVAVHDGRMRWWDGIVALTRVSSTR